MQNDFPAERRSMLPHGFALFSFSMFSGPILGVMTAITAHKACRRYDNEYDCQHEQRGKAHQHGHISPYLRNAEL